MGHVTEAPQTHVRSEVVAARTGFKIIRMKLPAGEGLPSHFSPHDAAIVIVSGEGRITVGDKDYPAEPGAVIEVPPNAKHGVYADEDLEIVIVQI